MTVSRPQTGVSGIRTPTNDLENHTVVLRQLKESVEVLLGVRGDPSNRSVTLGELTSAGVVRNVNGAVQPPGLYTVYEPTSLSSQSVGTGIQFTFGAPANVVAGVQYELLEAATSTGLTSAAVVWTGTEQTFTLAKTDTTTRYYWIRTVLPTGQRSFAYPASSASPTAAGIAGTGGTLDNVQNGATSGKVNNTNLTSGNVDISKSGVAGHSVVMGVVPAFSAPAPVTLPGSFVWTDIGHSGTNVLTYPGAFGWDAYVPAGGNIDVAVGNGTDGGGNYFGYMFRLAATGSADDVSIWHTANAVWDFVWESGGYRVSPGWHNATVVVLDPQKIELYVDGVLRATAVDARTQLSSGCQFGYSYDYEVGGAVAPPGMYTGYLDTGKRVSVAAGGVNPGGALNTNVASGGFTYTSTATSVTVSWPSTTLYLMDGTSQTVSAGNTTFSGLTASTTYTAYPFINPANWQVGFAGPALYAGGSASAAAAAANQAYIGLQAFTVATASGGGSGGGGGDNIGYCVDANMWVWTAERARDVKPGETLRVAPDDPEAAFFERVAVQSVSRAREKCYRLETEGGAAVVASESTPMTLRDGSSVRFPEMMGREARVLRGPTMSWERVVELEPVGERTVMRISLGGRVYFAGESPNAMVATHNYEKP